MEDYRREEVDTIYLSWPEINRIKNVALDGQPELKVYRDEFILGCFTGLRFSDFRSITPHDIRGVHVYNLQLNTSSKFISPTLPTLYNMNSNIFETDG